MVDACSRVAILCSVMNHIVKLLQAQLDFEKLGQFPLDEMFFIPLRLPRTPSTHNVQIHDYA
jgi:hypothetical protein